uniref:Reverse transcriptase domain-containing protein n=1 Tax=Aegilops tauschii subsp. strangulata TaxID=200361 RepID=A0A453JTB0_AEGTS
HRRKAKGVMLKLDISRAFDTIAWPFLFEVLRAKGFPDLWLSWIATLLTTTSSRVVVNGYAGPKFMHAQGLKQGDPIYPLLFVITMDVLTSIVSKGQEMGVLSTMPGCSSMQRISIYADDVVLFIRPSLPDLRFVKEAMLIFGTASGLKINFAKSAQF